MQMSLSRKNHMLSPRRVTIAPISWPSLTLKLAMDFLAFVLTTCWPVIASSSLTAASRSFLFVVASPTPTETVIFSSFGICIGVLNAKSFWSAGTTSLMYFVLKFGTNFSAIIVPHLSSWHSGLSFRFPSCIRPLKRFPLKQVQRLKHGSELQLP